MSFYGSTYIPELDYKRLSSQLKRFHDLMIDGQWRTLRSIAEAIQGSETGVSARFRDLKKPIKDGGKFGYIGNTRRTSIPGVFEYQIIVPPKDISFVIEPSGQAAFL